MCAAAFLRSALRARRAHSEESPFDTLPTTPSARQQPRRGHALCRRRLASLAIAYAGCGAVARLAKRLRLAGRAHDECSIEAPRHRELVRNSGPRRARAEVRTSHPGDRRRSVASNLSGCPCACSLGEQAHVIAVNRASFVQLSDFESRSGNSDAYPNPHAEADAAVRLHSVVPHLQNLESPACTRSRPGPSQAKAAKRHETERSPFGSEEYGRYRVGLQTQPGVLARGVVLRC